MKPKAKKHSGPKLSDLKSKCKELDIPTSGTKTILEDRIAAFERGEIKTITQTRDEKKAAKELKASSEKKKKEKKGKKRSSGKSSKSSKSNKSSKSSTSTKSSKSTSSGASLSELKSQLKAAGLPRTGNKAELDKRLAKFKAEQADGKVNYNGWKLPKIKDELKTRMVKVKAGLNKEAMIKLLQDDDAGIKVEKVKLRKKTKPVKEPKSTPEDSDSDSDCYTVDENGDRIDSKWGEDYNESDSDCDSDSDCSDCDSDSDSDSTMDAAEALALLRAQLNN
jgi:transglutaminase/protease-like cytokinesis protein 3